MKCRHCGFEYLQKGQKCGCRQAWADAWADVDPVKAYQIGVADRAAYVCDHKRTFDVPPTGTPQFDEYMFGYNLRTSKAGLTPSEILDRELSNA